MRVKILKINRHFRNGKTDETELTHNLEAIFNDKYGSDSFKNYKLVSTCVDSEYFYYFFQELTI